MGFWGSVGSKIRTALKFDKESLPLELAKGGTASTLPQTGFDLLQSYGQDALSDYLKLEHDLTARFVDYEEMDDYPELSAALDIYSEDSTQVDSLQNRSVWVDSEDETVAIILNDLFHKQLRIEEEITEIARTLVKYGQDYEEMLVTGDGLVGLNFLPPPTIRRVEGKRGELYGFVQDFKGKFGYSADEFKQLLAFRASNRDSNFNNNGAVFEDWEVNHMRLRTKQRRSIYGYSVLEPARWIWKRLMLMEDAALIYRLQRAPERYAFYIDTGEMPPREAMAHLNKYRQLYKKQKFYNPSTGKLDLKFNPLGSDEDIFLAMRKGEQSSKVEVLGSPAWQHMEDIEYFRLKLFAAIKCPKTYLGFDASPAKGILSQEDVRFARSVLRIQRELRNGLRKMARVHLAAIGIDPNAVEYEIYMTVPSSIFELAQLEVRNAKAAFAAQMGQFVSLHWILQKIFGLSEDEIEFIIKERHEEALADAEVQMKAQQMMQPPQPGAPDQSTAAVANAVQAEPNTAKAEQARQAVRATGGLSQMWRQKRQAIGYRNITESELFNGNKEHEKRVEDNLSKILNNNHELASHLQELSGLLNEIRYSMRINKR